MAGLMDGILGDDNLPTIFSAKPGGPIPTYDQLQNRRKIAQIMMARRNPAYPKTIGEGIASIGGDLADAMYMRQLNAAEGVQGAREDAAYKRATGGTPAVSDNGEPVAEKTAYAPTADQSAAVTAINNAITPTPIVEPSEFNALDAAANKDPWTKYSPALSGIETGGERNPYQALGKIIPKTGDRAYGKYQIMGANIPQWTQDALGQALTPAQFLANDKAQEATARHRFTGYVDKYGEEGAARAWYAGPGGMNKLDATDIHGRLSVRDYGQDFMRRLDQSPRDRVSEAITGNPDAVVRETATAPGVPQQNPMMADSGQPSTPITPAPPLTATDFSAQSRRAQPPAQPTPTQEMQNIAAGLAVITDPYKRSALEYRLKLLQENQQRNYLQQQEEYQHQRGREEQAPQEQINLAKGRSEAAIKAEEARIVDRTGMTPDKLYDQYNKEKASIDQTIKAQDAQRLARKAIKDGVITGYGADKIVAGAKFAEWAFNNGLKGDLAANTEIMSAAMKSGLSEAVKTINGEGGTGVSNTDVRIAEGISGSDPNLQLKTIQTIMDRASEINNRKINRYEEMHHHDLSGEKQELRYATNARPTAPPDHLKLLIDSQKDPDRADAIKAYFDKTYGPGAADLELGRIERARRRQR